MEKQRAATKVGYHERKLKALQSHLERGTNPKTLRLKTFPKMKTSQGQALVREACDEVQKMMLIQMVEEQKQALAQAQKEYQSKDITSLQREVKSLRRRLRQLQTSNAEIQVKPTEPEDMPKQTVNTIYVDYGCAEYDGDIPIVI